MIWNSEHSWLFHSGGYGQTVAIWTDIEKTVYCYKLACVDCTVPSFLYSEELCGRISSIKIFLSDLIGYGGMDSVDGCKMPRGRTAEVQIIPCFGCTGVWQREFVEGGGSLCIA